MLGFLVRHSEYFGQTHSMWVLYNMALSFIGFSYAMIAHIGLVSCIISDLDSVLLYVVKVTKS